VLAQKYNAMGLLPMRSLPTKQEAIRAAEHAAFDTARSHITAAKTLYDHGMHPQACFLAMTAIEETGKALLYQCPDAEENMEPLSAVRDHDMKAIFGAVAPLILNEEAKRRHGRNLVTGLDRIEAVRLLAEGGEWMPLRNACLYVDCKPDAKALQTPVETITREHAYLMLVAALEVYAHAHAPGFTYRDIPMDAELDDTKQRSVLAELQEFQERERGKVDLDRLNFISSAERVQQLRQTVRDARERAHQTALGQPATSPESRPAMGTFDLSDLDQQRGQTGKPYLEFLRVPALSLGLYVLPAGGVDAQQPHNEDEVYYVLSGRATIRVGEEDRAVQAGSVVFVPPGVPHRFHSITEELRVLVFFAPAEGTAK